MICLSVCPMTEIEKDWYTLINQLNALQKQLVAKLFSAN